MAVEPSSGTVALFTPTPNPAPGPQKPKRPCPQRMIVNGIRSHSTAEIPRALQLDRSLLGFALQTAVYRGDVPMTAFLATTEGAPVNTLSLVWIAVEVSVELLDTLVSARWDVNKRSSITGPSTTRGQRLLSMATWNEELVKWCIERGAQVTYEDE